jgi:DNA-binding SARP family transcriptional activator
VTLRVQLLGPPSIARDGQPVRLAGRKPWGFLTYLLLEDRPPTRRDIAGRLEPEANDPLAAVRWLLHQVRRAVEPEIRIEERDGRLHLEIDDGTDVDVLRLLAVPDDIDEIETLFSGELLDGMWFDDAPAFEMWLALHRTRVHDTAAEAIWWASTQLGSKDTERALRMVERGMALDPYCDNVNELFIDLLVQNGNLDVARDRIDALEKRYADGLGIPLPDTIRRPLDRRVTTSGIPSTASARGLLESARARLSAGDHDRAAETARRAADLALASGDPQLELTSLSFLAATLIHTHRGRDQEAKGLLSRAAQLANELGDRSALADVEREMAFVFVMEGDYGVAEPLLVRSVAHAEGIGDRFRAGKAETYLGICRSDRCAWDAAEDALSRAIDRFDRAGERGWQGYTEGTLARAIERSGDPERGLGIAAQGVERVRAAGWTAALPWPMLVAAGCAFASGRRDEARDRFAEAFTIGAEIGEPCWESLGLRGLSSVKLADGDRDGAVEMLEDALSLCRRYPDIYAWARALILTDLVELERGRDARHLDEALGLAVAGPIPDLAERLAQWSRPDPSPQTHLQTVTS